MAQQSIIVYIGIRTKRGKTKVVSVHYDRDYVWDEIFALVAEERPREWVIPEGSTRKEAMKIARDRGYEVHDATATYDTRDTVDTDD